MEPLTAVLLFYFGYHLTQGLPVSNGLSVNYHPLSVKEDIKHKTFDAMFAEIPQEKSPDAKLRREILSEAHFPHTVELGSASTNHIAKVINKFKKFKINNDTTLKENAYNCTSIYVPLVKQPLDKYQILIALAPPIVKISDQNKPLIIYIVFSEDRTTKEFNSINIPTVYFVSQIDEKTHNEEKLNVDPIIIVDSNRTVTGLKSKEISKYVTFRNKLINLFDKKYSFL